MATAEVAARLSAIAEAIHISVRDSNFMMMVAYCCSCCWFVWLPKEDDAVLSWTDCVVAVWGGCTATTVYDEETRIMQVVDWRPIEGKDQITTKVADFL